MKKKEKIILAIVTVCMIMVFAFIGFHQESSVPKNVYQVYLDGQKIGLVEDKDELLNLINEEQQEIKDTYAVDQVYPPNGFDIMEYVTYDENISSAEDIYKEIQEQSDFTVEG